MDGLKHGEEYSTVLTVQRSFGDFKTDGIGRGTATAGPCLSVPETLENEVGGRHSAFFINRFR